MKTMILVYFCLLGTWAHASTPIPKEELANYIKAIQIGGFNNLRFESEMLKYAFDRALLLADSGTLDSSRKQPVISLITHASCLGCDLQLPSDTEEWVFDIITSVDFKNVIKATVMGKVLKDVNLGTILNPNIQSQWVDVSFYSSLDN